MDDNGKPHGAQTPQTSRARDRQSGRRRTALRPARMRTVIAALAQRPRPRPRPSNCGSWGRGQRRRVVPRAWETAYSKAPRQAPDRAVVLLGPQARVANNALSAAGRPRPWVRRVPYGLPGRNRAPAASPQKICEPRTMAPRRSRALQICARSRKEIRSWPSNQRAGH